MSAILKYQVRLADFLSQIGKTKNTEPPRLDNTDPLLGVAFMWDFIASYAKGRSDAAWKELEEQGIVNSEGLEKGEYILAESSSFVCKANVTEKVKRFNNDELAKLLLKSKFKVPLATTVLFVEQAKKPTKSQVRLSIIER